MDDSDFLTSICWSHPISRQCYHILSVTELQKYWSPPVLSLLIPVLSFVLMGTICISPTWFRVPSRCSQLRCSWWQRPVGYLVTLEATKLLSAKNWALHFSVPKQIINRPGVAGAALQTPPSLTDWLGQRSFVEWSIRPSFIGWTCT